MLSVVLPAYNEEKMLAKAAGTISSVLEEAAIPYELVFVMVPGTAPGRKLRRRQQEIPILQGFIFRGILERKRQSLRGWQMRPGTAVP